MGEEIFKIKFLKPVRDQWIWPKTDDLDNVRAQHIFYGPLKLVGSGPFSMSRHDLIEATNTYKRLKEN